MSLWKGREFRESKVVQVVSGRRSFAEVVGLSKSPENDCFPEYNEPIARIPRWLKEASVAEVEGSTPAKTFGGQV
jgi:hypothetical protein